MEKAFSIAQKSKQEQAEAVEELLKNIKQNIKQLALLHKLNVISTKLLLQIYVYTQDKSIFDITGTEFLEPDVIKYLKLKEVTKAESEENLRSLEYTSQDDKNANVTDGNSEYQTKISQLSNSTPVDLEITLENGETTESTVKNDKINTAQSTRLKRHVEPPSLIKLSNTAKILKSSSSIADASKKLLQSPTQDTVAQLCETCYKQQVYNRFYGSVAISLMSSMSNFVDLLATEFQYIFTNCSEMDTDELRTIGTFYGHIMLNQDWSQFLQHASLDPETSTPSNRIMLMAMISELKLELDKFEIAKKIRDLNLGQLTDGELAKKFWKVNGLNI